MFYPICEMGTLRRDKSKLAALALLWMIPAGIFIAAFGYKWDVVWTAVGAYTRTPPFLDLGSVPAALRTMQHGGDPLVDNPVDTLHRPFNYPRIWLYAFSLLRITEHNVWIVGLVFCALYLLCISRLMLQREKAWEQLVLLFAALSVAPLFGIERGNNDLLVFAVVFSGCALSNRSQRAGVFLVATLLKLFPLAALVAELVRQRGRNRIWSFIAFVLAAALLTLQRSDLLLIRRGTPTSLAASFGVLSLQDALWYGLRHHRVLGTYVMVAATAAGAVLWCWLAGLAVAVWAWNAPNRVQRSLLESREGALFFTFGAIYVSSFVIGSNWDYRLIFLIPTLPFAFEMTKHASHVRWGVMYMLCVLFAENVVAFEWDYKSLLSQALTIAVFLMMLVILVQQLRSYLDIDRRFAVPVAPREFEEAHQVESVSS